MCFSFIKSESVNSVCSESSLTRRATCLKNHMVTTYNWPWFSGLSEFCCCFQFGFWVFYC